MNKTIGVVGLGLIGGSLAKALKAYTGHTVLGADRDGDVMRKAAEQKAIDAVFDDGSFDKCDYILIALYPGETKRFFNENITRFKRGTVVMDCAGVKKSICEELGSLAAQNGIYFIGGHPMAGVEKSGFDNSFAELFKGASMIFCKDQNTNIVALKAAELLFLSIGFGGTTVTTADEHDRIIAFTSQLAHIVSSAYIKSNTAKTHTGFSAGSYKDLTRVAKLNEEMWTELFFENRELLLTEAEALIERLEEYTGALKENDRDKMKRLLADGRAAKEAIG